MRKRLHARRVTAACQNLPPAADDLDGSSAPRCRFRRLLVRDQPAYSGFGIILGPDSTTGEPMRVLICGGGVIGATIAYFLSRRGVQSIVIERTGLACAASGKSGGFLALDWCDGTPLEPLARRSFALHAELARELATDYGYRRVDTFMLAARERGTPSGGHRVAAPGWLDGAGVVTATLGSIDTTAQVHPARFTSALLDAARAQGG